jgi:hypothetical protein
MARLTKILLVSLLLITVMSQLPHAQQNCGLVPSELQQQIQVNEPWYCPINQQIYNQWSNALPLAAIAIFISFMIAAIIFMTGIALNSNRIRSFGIGEFYEAIATAIIAALFLYICAVMFGILPGVLVGNINPYATSFNLITTTIQTAQNLYGSLFKVYLSLSFGISPQISLSIGGEFAGISRYLFNILGYVPQLIVNSYTIPVQIYYLDPALALSKFLVDGIMALYAEYYLMAFFATAAVPAFLIPGVIFRSIFPTRALGGILIAFAFGFYLIMPSLFAVAYYFTAPTMQRDMATTTYQIQNLGNGVTAQNAASPGSPLVVDLQNVQSSLNGFWLLIFFYPALIVAITYSAVQEIAGFIGRSSATMGRLRSFV